MELTLEQYETERKRLIEENAVPVSIVMDGREKAADALLSAYKEELLVSYDGRFPFDFPILTDEKLRESRLYAFCHLMPKGADLHVHDMALLPVSELIPLLLSHPEFCIDPVSAVLKVIPPEEKAPTGFVRFSEAMEKRLISEKTLAEAWSFAGRKENDGDVWTFFEGLFDKQAAFSDSLSFVLDYYRRAFRYDRENGVQHVEIHIMLTDDVDLSEEYLKKIRQAYYEVKAEHPDFSLRIIGAGVKADDSLLAMSKKCFLNTLIASESLFDESEDGLKKPFVTGFDLVNEEDGSLPLHEFVPMLLKIKKRYPGLTLCVHGGESLSMSNENLIDAYLLGAYRVGHGLNLYRYPALHSEFVKKEICLELCPVSNQKLGYTRDLRSHPAAEYLRTGMALALCSDDPGFMEYETLTDDFFAAAIAWDLSLADLKRLAINSILYSTLDEKSKFDSLRAFRRRWEDFLSSIMPNN